MSRTGWNRRPVVRPPRLALAWGFGLGLATSLGSVGAVWGQGPAPTPVVVAPGSGSVVVAPGSAVVAAPGTAVVSSGPDAAGVAPAGPVIPDDVMVVRFQGPDGAKVEVLGPAPEAVPTGDGRGLLTVGMRVGSAYSLRVSNLPDRPGVELYPRVEIVGHLHRPPGVDPGKYPIRINLRDIDIEEAADRGRLVTQVVYLEDPELAVPLALGKEDTPVTTISPVEDPLRVARALGRIVAVVHLGGRQPSPDELQGPATVAGGIPGGPCPFLCGNGSPCQLPCGPVCTPEPARTKRTRPTDEFLCDGGDGREPVHYTGPNTLAGVDPRDALVNFEADGRARVLPTNIICVFAPRFATVRVGLGANEALSARTALMNQRIDRQALEASALGPKKLAQGQGAEIGRIKSKATGLSTRTYTSETAEVRVLGGFDAGVGPISNRLVQRVEARGVIRSAALLRIKTKADGIKTAESAVVSGIVQGGGQQVMVWTPLEVASVETPPNKPGLAVVKLVSADEAEPGDTLTYTIQYRNMGNTPIRAVSVIDSLLPRLEYVANTAQGPAGTIFTFGENKAGSLELRWDIPGAVAPGTEGAVSFRAIVR